MESLIKKKKINSKNKGNSGERRVAAILSEWAGIKFERTPGSGATRWKEKNNAIGDIVCPMDFYFPFIVEVKLRKDIKFEKINATLKKFWDQNMVDSLRANKDCMVFFRKNGMPYKDWYLMVSEKLINTIDSLISKYNLELNYSPKKFVYQSKLIEKELTFYLITKDNLLNFEFNIFIEEYGKYNI